MLKPIGEFPGTNMIQYRVPLGDRRNAVLVLPRDLTHQEISRLERFMGTLVLEARNDA